MKKKIYAIVDIETTGGRANRDKITEIGIVLHDGEQVIDQYESLINPERSIPNNITNITGINDEMVADAPKFYEVAKKIVEMTEGAIFVAHNVRFDYTFIKEEFKRLGFVYTRKQLCTVRLSRKTFPGLPSYSLGKLMKHFGIKAKRRHRALDDAVATTELLELIFKEEHSKEEMDMMINLGVKESTLPKNVTLEILHSLPEECGVYYFHDERGDMVYVGKSINIKKRVMEHFSKTTRKAAALAKHVHGISFEVTGSELVALLQESHEIKHHLPYINKAQRTKAYPYVIFSYEDGNGYLCFSIKKATEKQKGVLNIIREYGSLSAAKSAMDNLLKNFELCRVLCNIESVSRPCFSYHLQQCKGACIEEESPEDYNLRAREATDEIYNDLEDSYLILDKGRTADEQAVVLVEQGIYRGFGYVDTETMSGGIEELMEAINPFEHNPDVVRIIRHFLFKKEGLKVIPL